MWSYLRLFDPKTVKLNFIILMGDLFTILFLHHIVHRFRVRISCQASIWYGFEMAEIEMEARL